MGHREREASCRSHRRSPGPDVGVLGLYDKRPSERFLCFKLSELAELHSAQGVHMLLSNFFYVNPKFTFSSPSPLIYPLPPLAWTAQLPPDWPPHFTAASSFPSHYRQQPKSLPWPPSSPLAFLTSSLFLRNTHPAPPQEVDTCCPLTLHLPQPPTGWLLTTQVSAQPLTPQNGLLVLHPKAAPPAVSLQPLTLLYYLLSTLAFLNHLAGLFTGLLVNSLPQLGFFSSLNSMTTGFAFFYL